MWIPQGWTKMTKFGDLDAMDDADWDKVSLQLSSLLPVLKGLIIPVLVNQCEEQLPPFQGCSAYFQCQSRWWCFYSHLFNCGMAEF